jgi:uncharacterized coiled-coil DUF342 family protein
LVCKQQFSDGFSQKSVVLLEEVKGLAEQFDEKIDYLDAVIEQIDQLRLVRIWFNLRMKKKMTCLAFTSRTRRRYRAFWLRIAIRE